MRVAPLDRPRLGHQPLYILNFLNLSLDFESEFKVLQLLSCFIQNIYNDPVHWQAGCVCTNRNLFLQTGPQKMRELYILCLEGGLVSPKRARITGCAALWRIFKNSNKRASANRKKRFYTKPSAQE
jgi:hypothetical protein